MRQPSQVSPESVPITLADVPSTYRRDYSSVELVLREMFTVDQFAAIGRDPLRLVVNAAHPLAGQVEASLADFSAEGFIAYPTLHVVCRRLSRPALLALAGDLFARPERDYWCAERRVMGGEA